MHVLKHDCSISCDSHPFFDTQIHCHLLHVQHVVEGPLGHVLKHYVDVGDLGDHTHQDRDVRVAKDRLHYDLVLDLL
jgi:hypothetical protein